MALGTHVHAEQQRAEDIKNGRKALNDVQQAFSRTFKLWGLIPLTAVTAVTNACGASASMGDFYPAFKVLLFEFTPKLAACALDIRTARARITKAEESYDFCLKVHQVCKV